MYSTRSKNKHEFAYECRGRRFPLRLVSEFTLVNNGCPLGSPSSFRLYIIQKVMEELNNIYKTFSKSLWNFTSFLRSDFANPLENTDICKCYVIWKRSGFLPSSAFIKDLFSIWFHSYSKITLVHARMVLTLCQVCSMFICLYPQRLSIN